MTKIVGGNTQIENVIRKFDKTTMRIGIIQIILALVMLIFTVFSLWYQQKIYDRNAESKLVLIDHYNISLACSVLSSLQGSGIPLMQYDTRVYKDNLDFIDKLSDKFRAPFFLAIALMDISNKMTEVAFTNFAGDEEIKKKLDKSAKDIIGNMKKYDNSLANFSCS